VILLKIGIQAESRDGAVIKELLSPWNISFTENLDPKVTIVYGQKPNETSNAIVIPSDDKSFASWAKNMRLVVSQKNGTLLSVQATPRTTLFITPTKKFTYETAPNPDRTNSLTHLEIEEDSIVLKLDVIKEFNDKIQKTLNPKQSTLHKIVTGLPIPYGLAPTRIRDLLMKANNANGPLSLFDKLPIDALRYALVNAIQAASGQELEKKSIFNNNYVCMITHDIERADGLKKALFLKKIEERYDIMSSWYVPSKRYKLNDENLRRLSYHGEIGSHDTKHDGKLAHLPKQEIVSRISESRQYLSEILQQPVQGFRAPILQHNATILEAVEESGYTYDTSIPTWEPKHPYTMKPHGIGTVYPLTFGKLREIPLTLPQDHQLLHVLGLNPEEVMKTWASMAMMIRDLGGVCMFLVHPDYELGDKLELYEEFVTAMTSDAKSTITVPSHISSLMSE
jgi:peptidoglycan/xylan/chitin deacetylase (PgdA/CDA1 family)